MPVAFHRGPGENGQVTDQTESVAELIYQAIHQESDVIPEEVDCIRAMCSDNPDKMASIEKTDKALGLA